MQEAAQADLLLHVVDGSNPDHPEQIAEVRKVLEEIGAGHLPQVLVFNKLDAMPSQSRPLELHQRSPVSIPGTDSVVDRIFVSARTGEGLGALRKLLLGHASAGSAIAGVEAGLWPPAADGLRGLGTMSVTE